MKLCSMSDDLFLQVADPDYSYGCYPDIPIVFEEVHLEICISIKAVDIQPDRFDREEPLDDYSEVNPPYDKRVIWPKLYIHMGDFLP